MLAYSLTVETLPNLCVLLLSISLTGGMICYGFYQVKKSNQERNYQKLAERQIRYNLAPFLQAEADRVYMQKEAENLKKEAEVMKDVSGWEVGKNPYNSGVWMPRHVYDLSRDIK
jgi:uncharacterized membrane protein affecting hemolysin expression